jgi:hypothetical protein
MTLRQSPHAPGFPGLRSVRLQRTQRGKCCGRFLCLIVLAALAVVTGGAVRAALAQTVDPQSLVGVWEGTWVGASVRDAQGTLNMAVTKVEGNQVHGRFERMGWANRQVRFDFVGTLEGDKLVFSGPANIVELTISGTQMRGTELESIRMNISMTKRK